MGLSNEYKLFSTCTIILSKNRPQQHRSEIDAMQCSYRNEAMITEQEFFDILIGSWKRAHQNHTDVELKRVEWRVKKAAMQCRKQGKLRRV